MKLFLAAATLALSTTVSHSQVVSFNFDSAPTNSGSGFIYTVNPTSGATPPSDVNTTANPASVTFSSANNHFQTPTGADGTGHSAELAQTANSDAIVLTFTPTAAGDYSLSFDYNNAGLSGPLAATLFLESNGASVGQIPLSFTAQSGFRSSGSIALPTITNTNPYTIRFANFTSPTDQAGDFRIDNLQVSVVPEPSTYVAGFAMLGLVGYRVYRDRRLSRARE